MNSYHIHRSRSYMLQWLLLLIGAFLIGIYAFHHGEVIGGTIVPIGCAIAIAMFLKGYGDPEPRITITERGIKATEFKGLTILWEDIENVVIHRYPRVGRIIVLNLRDEEKYKRDYFQEHGKKFNQLRLYDSSFMIMADGLEEPPAVIYDKITKQVNIKNTPEFPHTT